MPGPVTPDPGAPRRAVVTELLTPRERDVLGGLALGFSNRVIADYFSLTEKTVKNRVSDILKKLKVKNRSQAACWALQHGWDGKAIFGIEEEK